MFRGTSATLSVTIMPRTFWYHFAAASIISIPVTLLVTGRHSYTENALYDLFKNPGGALAPQAIPLLIALLGVVALLSIRINATARPLVFIPVYATVLFLPFLFLAIHNPTDLLALLLFVISVRSLMEQSARERDLLVSLLLLLAAILVRGELALFAFTYPLYLVAAGRRKAAFQFTILFAFIYTALAALDLGSINRIRILLGSFTTSGAGVVSLFRNSIEVQLLLGFTPFIFAALTALTIRSSGRDRSALLLILLLPCVSLLLLPGALHDTPAARLLFMSGSLWLLLGAASGAVCLEEVAGGSGAIRWSAILVGLFFLPVLVSFV